MKRIILFSNVSYPSLFNEKSIYPGTQMKIPGNIPNSSLSLTSNFDDLDIKICVIYRIESLLTNFTTTLVKYNTISCLNHCSNLLFV